MSEKAKCLLSQDSGHQVATDKKKHTQKLQKHDTPDETEKKLRAWRWKSETLDTQTGRKKKDHRHKSGMSGKAKCLPTRNSGHQVATEKKKHTQTAKTRHTRRNRENAMSLEMED